MKVLDLFSGIGGFSLAAQWVGMETVGFVEIDPYCQKVLAKHWPGVPIFSDIREFRGDEVGPVDLVCGGFPCQPFSTANRTRRGKGDERYLWGEMFRVISAVRPNWVLGENVTAIDGAALEEVIDDMESIGYKVAPPFEIPACSVGAPHQRYRVFVVAYSDNQPKPQAHKTARAIREKRKSRNNAGRSDWRQAPGAYWAVPFAGVLGVHDGFPNRVDRVKALGNAVDPRVAEFILRGIKEVSA